MALKLIQATGPSSGITRICPHVITEKDESGKRYTHVCEKEFTPADPRQKFCCAAHSANNSRRISRRENAEVPAVFTGIDGEGVDKWDGHRYVLLGYGTEQIDDPAGLKIDDIFEFVYDQFLQNPKTATVGFFLGYDFNRILSQLPEDRARMLWTTAGMTARRATGGKRFKRFPVRWKQWDMDALPGRKLSLRKRNCTCDLQSSDKKVHQICAKDHKHLLGPWLHICDAGPFFQTSFLNVINPAKWQDPIVSQAEYEMILQGKERRDSASLDNDMRKYNALENEILSRVMTELDRGFRAMGVRLQRGQWFGPGQAAHVWLRNEGVPRRDMIIESVPAWALEAARKSYFGGWFEIMAHGIIPGITHGYDINSAYPYQIASLPCLLHGVWSQNMKLANGHCSKLVMTEKDYALVYAKVVSPDGEDQKFIGTMLHRDKKGLIRRPVFTEGWYWKHELDAAERAGCILPPKIKQWIKYEPCDCFPPVRHIANLYDMRLAVGKNSPLGMASKLVYNSAYGKFAQSVGKPAYANPIYASLITAGCRAQILDAIASHPKGMSNVIMVATDAVYFLDPHPGLPISNKLGEWDHSGKSNLTLFKPGIYWDDEARRVLHEGKVPALKTRGVNIKDFASRIDRIDDIFRLWTEKEHPEIYLIYSDDGKLIGRKGWPKIDVQVSFKVLSIGQALNGSGWNTAGEVSHEINMVQSASPYTKRSGCSWYRDVDPNRIVFRSRPQFSPGPSVPYEKKFGLEDPYSVESRDMLGVDQDGELMMQIGFIMRTLAEGKE